MILQKPMRVQGKMKWFDDQILEKAQEWQGLTPLAEGHEMKVTSYISNLPCTWQKEGECVWERRKQWEKEIPNYAQETESEGFSNILQHHTTKNVAHQRFKLNLEAVHSFGGSVITAVLTYLSKNKLSNIY